MKLRQNNIYYNKNDPRVFLYNNPRHKWLGLKPNLAHPKAWLVIILSIAVPVALFLGLMFVSLVAMFLGKELRDEIILGSFFAILLLSAIVSNIYAFRMAARDAKNHPKNSELPNS